MSRVVAREKFMEFDVLSVINARKYPYKESKLTTSVIKSVRMQDMGDFVYS